MADRISHSVISVAATFFISDIKHYISAALTCTNKREFTVNAIKQSENDYPETGVPVGNEFYSLGYSAVLRKANFCAWLILRS
jgi:hypothetical protein